MPVFLSRLSGFPLPAVLRGPLICKVPVRARFRSDKHAAVLRLQNTQPKDRRVYDDPYRNPCNAEGPHSRTGLKPDGKILRAAGSM